MWRRENQKSNSWFTRCSYAQYCSVHEWWWCWWWWWWFKCVEMIDNLDRCKMKTREYSEVVAYCTKVHDFITFITCSIKPHSLSTFFATPTFRSNFHLQLLHSIIKRYTRDFEQRTPGTWNEKRWCQGIISSSYGISSHELLWRSHPRFQSFEEYHHRSSCCS